MELVSKYLSWWGKNLLASHPAHRVLRIADLRIVWD